MARPEIETDTATIACMYAVGKPAHEIAAEIGVSTQTVLRRLKASGLHIKTQGERMRGTTAKPEFIGPRLPRGARNSINKLGASGLSSQGYVRINTGAKKRQYEHVLKAEKAIGRRLKPGEVVHHINCDRTDNRNENLLVCSHKYHLQLHARMRRNDYWRQFN